MFYVVDTLSQSKYKLRKQERSCLNVNADPIKNAESKTDCLNLLRAARLLGTSPVFISFSKLFTHISSGAESYDSTEA